MTAAFELIVLSIDLVTFFVTSVIGGWLYLLSPSFRRSTRERWKGQTQLAVVHEIFGGFLGVATTLAFVLWLVATVGKAF